jgi:hypothetical protein
MSNSGEIFEICCYKCASTNGEEHENNCMKNINCIKTPTKNLDGGSNHNYMQKYLKYSNKNNYLSNN